MNDESYQEFRAQLVELQQQLDQNNGSDSNIQNQISKCNKRIHQNRRAYKREIDYCKNELCHATYYLDDVKKSQIIIQERLTKHKALGNQNWQSTTTTSHSSSRCGMYQPLPVVYGSTATHDPKVDNEVTHLVGKLSDDLRNELLQFYAFITATLVEKCEENSNDESNIPNSI
eukprot:CAMPEP_0119551262 /NCGR_PEP_ID=MMETSP1352-20130426/4559_1 /TAXON_ID=265584 /ORGANISM="Stauroneis constricta, Strain CCMP1120" /LENGTH=172 /DNA_ID=CAMNT_0007597283 /DNA_START=41 /DNA_END=556 /DNA_ORIENTATION=-